MQATDAGYAALRESAAWFDLSARGRLRATGEDRKRLLHALTTNDIQSLTPGQGCYAFFLNAQGRVLGDAVILCRADDLLILTEPETREPLFQHIDRYIIADDVTLEDLSAATCELALEGPTAGKLLTALGFAAPDAEYHCVEKDGITVFRTSATGAPGFCIIAPLAQRAELCARLQALAPEAAAEEVLAVRLEHARPRYGDDISERYIAHETNQLHAVHFSKGCYLGQEIVERVRSRGLVNRRLAALRIAGSAVPATGAQLLDGEKECGEITSAAWSPAEQTVRALGYLRVESLKSVNLRTAGGEATQVV